MELDILHKSQSPYIVDFYGAFFIESTVYLCMEVGSKRWPNVLQFQYMDAGSLDKLYGEGVPEPVLARIAHSVGFLRRVIIVTSVDDHGAQVLEGRAVHYPSR